MRTYLLILLSVLSLQACTSSHKLPEGVTLIEKVSTTDEELVIPYQKYQLSNGLTVILHEDRSDPLVHVDVTYHVGSAREEVGKSGFAHFFEHMMFQGSQNVADEQHFKIISEAGGTLNGTTNRDRTNYFQTVPSNQLERVLWLEADRMGFLLDSVTQKKFEIQRATVKNERAQMVDNAPYGRLSERVSEALYPVNHPYSWPTIGWVEDLDRVNVNDLKAFFLRWYGPNNATLTVGGDIDVAQTLAWVSKYYGSIPVGPEVENETKALITLDKDRYISMEDRVHLPLLYLSYPTVYVRHEDEAALDLLAQILGGGKTSLFYKNLVKGGTAVQAGVSHPCDELACTFSLYALANPQKVGSLAEMEAVIRASVNEFEARGVTEDDLLKAKVGHEADIIFGLQSVRGKVSTLAYYQTFTDNPNRIGIDLKRYTNVTKEDVERVYQRYIKDKPSVVMSVVPKGKKQWIAHADNFVPVARELPDHLVLSDKDLQFRPAKDNFDRSVMPAAGKTPTVLVPEYWEATLENNIAVMSTENDETPTETILINIEGGPLLDPLDKAGLAQLTAAMMNESTENYSTEEMTLALEKLGSRISVSSSGRYTQVMVTSLSKYMDQTLELLEERLFHPKFDPADFRRLQAQAIQRLAHERKDPHVAANRAQKQLLYGSGERVGRPDAGTENTVANIVLEDIKQFYTDNYSPKVTSVVAVGSLNRQELLPKLNRLGKWEGPEVTFPEYGLFPEYEESRLHMVHQPGAEQSVLLFTKRALPFDATGEYFKVGLMNFNFGGNFNSRINLNLREDKGYTYGTRSGFSGGKTLGNFSISASVKKDATVASIKELLMELERYRAVPLTDEEMTFMQRSVSQREALGYETPVQKAQFLRRLQSYGLQPTYTLEQGELIQSVTSEQLHQLAVKWFDPASMQLVVVGDKDKLDKQLKELSLPVEQLKLLP